MQVYRLRSITLAADTLNSTQPGVSRALKRLTEQLDTQLFVREGRGIVPTQAAIQLANDIEPALNTVLSALDNLKAFDTNQARTFKLVVTEPMLLLLQPQLDNSDRLGNCRVQLVQSPPTEQEMLHQLTLQQADLALDIGHLEHHSFQVKPVHHDTMMMVCAKGHPQVQGSIDQDTYYQAEHVTLTLRRAGHHAINYLSTEVMQARKVALQCDSLFTGMALAANSQVLSLAPKATAEQFADTLGLQVLPLPFTTLPVVHNLIWHKRTSRSAAHIWLRELVTELLAESNQASLS